MSSTLHDEPARLAALHELEIIDTSPEQIYDDVVQLAATICETPIAIINLIDSDRQWGKAMVGIESSEAPREFSFCSETIRQQDGLMIISDARSDPRWSQNPLVTGEPGIRFYAGASIVTDDGHALGAVCVIDNTGPRELDQRSRDALRILARQTAEHLRQRGHSSELSRANAELRLLATSDTLTGLANRAMLEHALSLALHQRRRGRSQLGVLFCDLDGFKIVNDRYGHHAGDQLLQLVASRLRETSRSSDLVARLAGDEFVVVCPELSAPGDLEPIARRFTEAVNKPATLGELQYTPCLSVGAMLARDADSVEDLLRGADHAMYEVKRAKQPAA